MSVRFSVIRTCLLYELKLGQKCRSISKGMSCARNRCETTQKWFKKSCTNNKSLDNAPHLEKLTVNLSLADVKQHRSMPTGVYYTH